MLSINTGFPSFYGIACNLEFVSTMANSFSLVIDHREYIFVFPLLITGRREQCCHGNEGCEIIYEVTNTRKMHGKKARCWSKWRIIWGYLHWKTKWILFMQYFLPDLMIFIRDFALFKMPMIFWIYNCIYIEKIKPQSVIKHFASNICSSHFLNYKLWDSSYHRR